MTWAFTTWLGLVALQAVVSRGGSGRISQAFTDLDKLLERVLDPTVPAIPDRRAGSSPATSSATSGAATRPATSTTDTTIPRLPVPSGAARAV